MQQAEVARTNAAQQGLKTTLFRRSENAPGRRLAKGWESAENGCRGGGGLEGNGHPWRKEEDFHPLRY